MRPSKAKKKTTELISLHLLLILSVSALSIAPVAQAQVVYSINGGTSTFSQSQGGWATFQTRKYDLEFGGGTMYGEWGFGGVARRSIGHSVYSLGDTLHTIYMPTDLFSGGRSVFMTGFGVDSKDKNGKTDAHLYAGGISNFFQGQFFRGANPQQAAALWVFNGKTGKNSSWLFTQQAIFASHSTLLEGVQWRSPRNTGLNYTKLGATFGLVDMHQPYEAVSADVKRRTLSLRAEYIGYGRKSTALLNIPTLQYGEPVNENVSGIYHPFRFLQLQGWRRNLLVFPGMTVNTGQTGSINTTDMTGATLQFFKTSLTGTYYDSKYRGQKSHGEAVSAGRTVTRYLTAGGSYGRSYSTAGPAQTLASVFVMERLTPQWNLRQTYIHTNNSSFMTYGGEYFSNRFSAGVYYNTTYIPTNIARPYQPNYSFNGTVKFTSRIHISASKSIDPYGKGYYIASATLSSYSTGWAGDHAAIHIGGFAVRGQVVTPYNDPVSGIAILIDKALIYTDMNGNFELREHRSRTHRISVDIDQSATQLNYEVISTPSRVESVEDGAAGITIVVKPTKKARGAAQMFSDHQQITGQAMNSYPASPSAPASKPAATNEPALAASMTAATAAPTSGTTPTTSVTYGSYLPYKPLTPTTSDRLYGTPGQE